MNQFVVSCCLQCFGDICAHGLYDTVVVVIVGWTWLNNMMRTTGTKHLKMEDMWTDGTGGDPARSSRMNRSSVEV
eukprot:scaffold10737_cov70-Cylindrotheca_fusiformis.AAC.1